MRFLCQNMCMFSSSCCHYYVGGIWLESVEQGRTALCLLSLLLRRCCNLLLATAQGQVDAATPTNRTLWQLVKVTTTTTAATATLLAMSQPWREQQLQQQQQQLDALIVVIVIMLLLATVVAVSAIVVVGDVGGGYWPAALCHFSAMCLWKCFHFYDTPTQNRLLPIPWLLWCGKFLWN